MKKHLLFKLVLTFCLSLFLSVGALYAQVSLPHYEGFDYAAAANLGDQTNWTNLNSGDEIIVASGSLSYSGLEISTGNSVSFAGGGFDPYLTYEEVTSGSVFASFIFKVTDISSMTDLTDGGYFAAIADETFSYDARIWVRPNPDASGSTFDIGFGNMSSVPPVTTGTFNLDDEIFVVISYNIDNGDVACWINPSSTDFGGTAPTATITGTDASPASGLSKFFIRQDSDGETGALELDELRVGITWADVTPDDTPETDPPVATFEEDGETDILPYENLTITIDEAILKIDASEVTDGDLSALVVLRETNDVGAIVPFSATIDANKKVITVDPTSDLTNDQLYYIALNPVEDANGNESVLQTGSFTVIGALVPYIDVTYPLGGEQFYAGDEITVTWNHANIVGNVDVLAYVPVNDAWEVMLDNTPCDGTEAFTIPVDAQYSDLYKIKVQDDGTGLIADSSNVITVVSIPTINEIQSTITTGDESDYNGHVVKTSGIVTAIDYGKYFIQDGDGGWNGIQVSDGTNTPAIGDNITITAEVEDYDVTVLKNVSSYTVTSSGNTLPNVTVITTGTIDELHEGILVKIVDTEITNADAGYGEFVIDDGSGELNVDDDIYLHTAVLNDHITITGVTTYSYGAWKLLPRSADDIISADATVSSTKYTIDNDIETIIGVPFSEDLATFESNITPASGADFDTYEGDGTTVATDLATGYLVIGVAEDGITEKTYTITIDAANPDASLSGIKIDGGLLSGFVSTTYDYEKVLDAGTTETPTVTVTVTFEYAEAVIDDAVDVTSDTEADRTTTITVTAEDGTTELVYTIVFSVDPTGINELATGFKIYPNPGTGLFKLEMNNISNGDYTVEVYDVIGKVVYKSNITESITNIDLTHMNSGLYYVSVNKGEERNITKIMIQ